MSSKPTLYLLAAVAVLLAFGYFFEFNRPGTKEANAEAKRLVTFDRDKISGLTVTDHDLKIELQQDDAHHWRLKSPLADRADHARIDEVMTELETARVDETFKVNDDDKSKLGELGLLAPHVRLLVTRNDNSKPVEILFGNDTAIEGKVYARIEGTNQVAITSNELRKLLQKDTNAWRDHRAVDVATTDVSRFTIKNSSGEIELQRDGTHWKIAKPLSARGDDSRINDLLSQATNLAVLKFVADDKADAATYGLATPRGVLTLYTADNAKGTELMIGDNPTAATPAASPAPGTSPTPAPTPAAPENAVYIRQPARQAIFTVPTTVEAFLTLKPNDLRDHALARVNADTVDQVQITTGATPAACTLARKDQGWTVNGQPANAAGVPQLINALNAAQAVDFVADSAAPGDLARYGLDRPAVQVRFAAVASENTAESTAGEKPVATVDFGKEEGANVYARLEEEPFIVSVPKTVLGSVWADPLQWQPLDIVHADPEKITSLELAAKGAPPLALTRGAKGEWKTAEGGAAVDAGKMQSLLGTLSKLRAVRWVGGPSLPTYDLDNPENTLTFAAGADDKANGGKIHFGGRTAELTTYARMDGRPGVFLVSRPDAETLLQLAPVVPAQTPAPSPAATAAPVPPSEPVPAVTPPPVAAPEPTTAPMPTATPLSSPEPLPPVAPLPMGTATPSMTPVPEPSPTATPPPAATAAPTVEATPVPVPTITPTPVATPADIPVPAASPVP